MKEEFDHVNHPKQYTKNKAGIEVIEVTGMLNFDLGNAFKYLSRYKYKALPSEDVKKSAVYLGFYSSQLNRIEHIVCCNQIEIPRLLENIKKFIDVEDVGEVKRGMMTIYASVYCEWEKGFEDIPEMSLLLPEEYNKTVQYLNEYAESIKDKKPEDFDV